MKNRWRNSHRTPFRQHPTWTEHVRQGVEREGRRGRLPMSKPSSVTSIGLRRRPSSSVMETRSVAHSEATPRPVRPGDTWGRLGMFRAGSLRTSAAEAPTASTAEAGRLRA
jgi:hypothetical protein